MKLLLLALIGGTAPLAAPVKNLTAVGVCYAAPGCAGAKIKMAVTEKYCASLGGRSIQFPAVCRNL